MKKFIKENWFKVIIICIVVIAGLYLFNKTKPESEISDVAHNRDILRLKDMTTKILLSSHGEDVKYADFLKNLDKICPYYIPSGIEYRDCLANLLVKKEKVAEDLYNEILTIAQGVSEVPETDMQIAQRKDFIKSFKELHTAWKPYRDALCATQLSVAYGGSNQSGMVNTCKIYQTQLYINNLIVL